MVIITKICDMLTVCTSHNTSSMTDRTTNAIIISQGAKSLYNDGSTTYTLSSNQVLFVSKGASYSVECTKDGTIHIINFDGTLDYGPIFTKKISDTDKVVRAFESAKDEYVSEYVKISRLYTLFDIILSDCADKAQQRLKKAFDYINEHFCEEISNDFLADIAALSNIHFRRTFKMLYGSSPHEYIMSLRIAKAKRLLRESDESIENVGKLCGFKSCYYFSNAFKKATGVSPKTYAKQNPAI